MAIRTPRKGPGPSGGSQAGGGRVPAGGSSSHAGSPSSSDPSHCPGLAAPLCGPLGHHTDPLPRSPIVHRAMNTAIYPSRSPRLTTPASGRDGPEAQLKPPDHPPPPRRQRGLDHAVHCARTLLSHHLRSRTSASH